MYERRGDPMCPVLSFNKYVSKLHPGLDAFWQRPLDSFESCQPTWYCRVPVGKNTLSNMMPEISRKGNLSKIYTNHCVRATSITSLDNAGVEARHIMRASGHKSEASIRSYACRLSEDKARQMSDHLSEQLFREHKAANNKENNSALDLTDLPEQQLLDIFSDDNMFLEVNPTPECETSSAAAPAAASASNVISPVSNTPATTPLMHFQPQPLTVSNNTNMFSAGGMIPASAKNTHFLINPNISNSTVHFHFHSSSS